MCIPFFKVFFEILATTEANVCFSNCLFLYGLILFATSKLFAHAQYELIGRIGFVLFTKVSVINEMNHYSTFIQYITRLVFI